MTMNTCIRKQIVIEGLFVIVFDVLDSCITTLTLFVFIFHYNTILILHLAISSSVENLCNVPRKTTKHFYHYLPFIVVLLMVVMNKFTTSTYNI